MTKSLNLMTLDAVEGVVYGDIVYGDIVYGDIGDAMIVFFETIYKKDSNGYCSSELNQRQKETYDTSTFARVIALIQQDMRTALKGIHLPELRAQYRNEYLFSPEESAKISDYR